jgi:hypothetical protein
MNQVTEEIQMADDDDTKTKQSPRRRKPSLNVLDFTKARRERNQPDEPWLPDLSDEYWARAKKAEQHGDKKSARKYHSIAAALDAAFYLNFAVEAAGAAVSFWEDE